MKPQRPCRAHTVSFSETHVSENVCRQSRRASLRQGLATLFSALLLLLMPKCPLCLAAWVTFFTGVGLSLTVASWLRLCLIGASVGVLVLLVLFRLRRLLANRHSSERTTSASQHP